MQLLPLRIPELVRKWDAHKWFWRRAESAHYLKDVRKQKRVMAVLSGKAHRAQAAIFKDYFSGGSAVKNPPAIEGSLSWKDPLEKDVATHSSILAWRIPWTEEPGRLQSMESQRVGHDWVTWVISDQLTLSVLNPPLIQEQIHGEGDMGVKGSRTLPTVRNSWRLSFGPCRPLGGERDGKRPWSF